MWTQGTNTTGTKHTVCGSFDDENIDSIEVVSKTTGDTEVDSVTAQIRDGLFIARALTFFDGSNLATKATATATDLAENTVNTTNTGIDLDTTLDVWYEYDAAGRRTKKCEAGEYQSGDPYTGYFWNDAGYLKQVDIDYGTGEAPRYARAWLTWDPTGELVKLEIRTGSSLGSLTPGSGGTLVYLTKWTYFGGAVLVERDELPGTPEEKEYVNLAAIHLYQVDSSDDYRYYHHGARGSVAAITDSNAAIKALHEYDLYGLKLTNAGTVDNKFGFYGGTLLEQVGLIHRSGPSFYDPQAGRMIARRPHAEKRAVPTLLALWVAACAAAMIGLRRTRVCVVCLLAMLGVLCVVEVPDATGSHYDVYCATGIDPEAGSTDVSFGVTQDVQTATGSVPLYIFDINEMDHHSVVVGRCLAGKIGAEAQSSHPLVANFVQGMLPMSIIRQYQGYDSRVMGFYDPVANFIGLNDRYMWAGQQATWGSRVQGYVDVAAALHHEKWHWIFWHQYWGSQWSSQGARTPDPATGYPWEWQDVDHLTWIDKRHEAFDDYAVQTLQTTPRRRGSPCCTENGNWQISNRLEELLCECGVDKTRAQ